MTLRRREVLILGAVAAAAAAAGGIVGALALQSRSGAADLLSYPFSDLAGEPQRLVQWQGQVLLCNFWATWCAPCREELPLLDSAQRENGARGLQVVGIAVDNATNVLDFQKTLPVEFPILLGGAGAIDLMRRVGNPGGGLPFTVLLDRHGSVKGRKLGAYTEAELRRELEALLR